MTAGAAPIEVTARCGSARAGVVRTARGSFRTPCFMPVGTRGTVRALTSLDVEALGYEVVLANTYHLMLRPGAELIARLGGIHVFAGWPGHVLTDSGGYQVFSLGPRVDDDGVTFRSTYDGSWHRLTPEDAVRTQEAIGSDIQMVLDVCAALPAPPDVLARAVDRTAAWAARAREAHSRPGQALFGIVQGGTDPELRVRSARATVALDFDGYGIGGLSVGEPRPDMLRALDATVPELPGDRIRYLMGVGDPVGLVEAVARGIDMFDCVLPTRLGRHGTALTGSGRLSLKGAARADEPGPIDPGCPCAVCGRWSRAFLRHLLSVDEPAAARMVSLHNLAWTRRLMDRIGAAVAAGTITDLRREVAAAWERGREVPD
ncbi:MAG TPA: tRNA guanosine(34) transglycosylase Tgt [Acidimicrobiales bacterium]|nr:tRNA guanosine(34) transglycosylase Tgt [Acidimicrobiales bacterium]